MVETGDARQTACTLVSEQEFRFHRSRTVRSGGHAERGGPGAEFFPESAPADASEHLKSMRVKHLLSMSGGHDTEPKFNIERGPSVKEFLAHPVLHAPGTWFRYNTPSTYMCSAIVTKVTGQTVFDFLRPRLFEPLGFGDVTWSASSEGYSLGGYGLSARTEDIAKFGLLYLQKGRWNGKQILPEAWVETATAKHVENDQAPSGRSPEWRQGYGFQFWRCRHNAYRGDGRDGQICLVMPDQDAVVVMTAQTGQMQLELDLVWEKLLPAFRPNPLPENSAELETLRRVLTNLEAHPLKKTDAK
jgi:CubicO group peptidase (beta-lactamase class C family)